MLTPTTTKMIYKTRSTFTQIYLSLFYIKYNNLFQIYNQKFALSFIIIKKKQ